MNLDDYKALNKTVTAPEDASSGDANLHGFIRELRARDQLERRRWLGMALILFPLGVVFMIAGSTPPAPMGLIGVGSMLAAAYLGLKSRGYGRADYSAPAQEFLSAAEKRHQFWRAKDLPFIVPLLLILGLAGGMTVRMSALKYLNHEATQLVVAGYVVFFVLLCVFAWTISHRKWQRETAALLEEIRCRRKGLENG